MNPLQFPKSNSVSDVLDKRYGQDAIRIKEKLHKPLFCLVELDLQVINFLNFYLFISP